MSNKIFRTTEEAVEYLFSKEIEADILALPPDVHEDTDEDEADDEEIGCAIVQDIPGTIEVNIPDDDPQGNDHNIFEENDSSEEESFIEPPKRTTKKISNSKKRQKYEILPEWAKSNISYNFGTLGNEANENFEKIVVDFKDITPVQIFEQFFTHDLISFILEETKKYAHQWKNKPEFTICENDLRIFIGFLIFSGYHTLPSQKDYWSECEDLGVPLVRNAIPQRKYLVIKSMIHFADNNDARNNKNDKGFKIRKLMTLINQNFQKWGVFHENLSIDEMIVRYYGHYPIKQFIRGKPIRFGYKLWALCGNDGYCYNFDLYCGKENPSSDNSLTKKITLGSRVVQKMLQVVKDPNSHRVFFDNFFTSHDLLVELKLMGIRASGTMRENRTAKCPLESSKTLEKRERGAFDYFFDEKNMITLVRWNDNKCVTLGTNFDFLDPMISVSRHVRGRKEKINVKQPTALDHYNKFMGGVDHHDWLLEKHAISIRGKKWYWPLFTRFVDMAIVNSFLLYNKINKDKKETLKNFRRYIAVSYLKLGVNSRQSVGRHLLTQSSRAKVLDSVRLDGIGHIIAKREKQRRCQFSNCGGKPLTYCTKCNVTLCTNCFPNFHK